MAVNPTNGDVYVTNASTVSVINPATNQVTATITGFTNPSGVAASSGGNVYVTNFNGSTVSVINPFNNQVAATITGFTNPSGVAASPRGNVYVINYGSNTVSVINPTTNAVVGSPITVGSGPTGVAVNPSPGGDVYVGNVGNVGNDGTPTVSVINTATSQVTATIPLGTISASSIALGVAVNPVTGDLQDIYAAPGVGNTVTVLSG